MLVCNDNKKGYHISNSQLVKHVFFLNHETFQNVKIIILV